jgi:aldehyde dehydrogenase (NAD+)
LVQKQRDYFLSGATRSIEFRKQQLQKLKKLVVDNKDAFVEAIYKDLHRSKPYADGEIDQIASKF